MLFCRTSAAIPEYPLWNLCPLPYNRTLLAGLNLYVRSGQEWKEVAKNDGGHYELRTGYTYKVVRVLPDDYQGVLPGQSKNILQIELTVRHLQERIVDTVPVVMQLCRNIIFPKIFHPFDLQFGKIQMVAKVQRCVPEDDGR